MSNIGHNSKEFEELNRKEKKLINDINDKKKMDKLVEASNRIRTTSHYEKLTDFAYDVGDSVKNFISKYSTPLHYGEPDNPVLDIISPIINFFSDVKNWIISQIKSIPVIGDLFQSEDEKLAEEVEDLNAKIEKQKSNQAEAEALIAEEQAFIAKQKSEVDTGDFRTGCGGSRLNLIKEAESRIKQIEANKANSLAITQEAQSRLDQIEATKAQTDAMNNLINQLDAVATASGNGAADSFRAMQGNNGSQQGGVMATNVTDASVTNVSKSETVLGEANVDPRGESDYYNYGK